MGLTASDTTWERRSTSSGAAITPGSRRPPKHPALMVPRKLQSRLRTVNVVVEDSSNVSKGKTYVNPGHLEADTMLQFLSVSEQEKLAADPVTEKEVPPIYRDRTLSRAAQDVKLRVKEAGNKLLPQKPAIKDMNFNYREKNIEKIGRFERAFVRSTMYKKPALPDFDVGYDCV